jgi:succinyl-CoA synthetase beta subunit/citryl-CoA synthetase large subunit
MVVLEHEAKALLRELGLPVPDGLVAASAAEAEATAQRLKGPVVIKAQVPASGRMKAGGIRLAASPAEAAAAAAELLGSTVRGFAVGSVLVETRVSAVAEAYAGAAYDTEAQSAVLLAGRAGGNEVETNGRVERRAFPSAVPLPDFVGRELAAALGFEGRALLQVAGVLTQLARAFVRWDALLLEVNPLLLDADGNCWLADAHLELDDEAAFRQATLLARLPSSRAIREQRTDFERRAAEIDSADHRGVAGRLVPFGGDLGLLIGGGGASLTIMDAVFDAGLRPANYCEIGGNPSVWKIKELTKLILSQPNVTRLAVIMNVVSNTRADLVARGVIMGILELGREPREVVAAFRVPGSWEAEGQAVLQHYGLRALGRETTLDQVVEAIA